MTVGSLFAGIGGFDLGLERAGMSVQWQVEIDPFCRRVLAKHWPDVRRYEDVREVHGRSVCPNGGLCDRCLEPVDLLCGGFPCQDISPAGRRAGIRGKQSGLWSEYVRLISELRPRYVVVENSSNLLARGFGMDVVLGELAAIRYDAEWDCLPAKAFGAPHERERVWIIAYPGQAERRQRDSERGHASRSDDYGSQSEDWCAAEGAIITTERSEPSDAHQEGLNGSGISVSRLTGQGGAYSGWSGDVDADADQERQPVVFGREALSELARFRAAHSGPWWGTEPEMVRVVHGVSGRLVRRRDRHIEQIGGLGNAVVPWIPEWIGRRILESEAAVANRERRSA